MSSRTTGAVAMDFNALFDENGKISMERVEAFLNKATQIASEQARVYPNHLVKVVHGGKVTWMTQKQASEFLETSHTPELQRDVQRALKGELKIIRQELEILLAIANYTLQQFKQKELVPKNEIERLEPSLFRRQKEISEGVAQSTECEAIMAEKRRKSPLLDYYEQMMGEFMNAKDNGNITRAAELAKLLASNKRQYLRIARAIEPDVQTMYYHRLNLQKTKKRIISSQNEICSTRKDALQLELEQLRENIHSVRQSLESAEEEGLDAAAAQIDKLRFYDADKAEEEIMEKSGELEALTKETSILERQENEVDVVIQHISENILKESEIKVNLEEIQKTPRKSAAQMQPSHQAEMVKSRGSGMHFKH
ncbi:MAG: hypothetical protein AB1656_12285 [Candidatus Omnitrophota bacterium]